MFLIFELLMLVGATIAVSRMAEHDRSEGFKWGAITFALCFASLFAPLPFLRMLLAIGVAFILMMSSKKTYY